MGRRSRVGSDCVTIPLAGRTPGALCRLPNFFTCRPDGHHRASRVYSVAVVASSATQPDFTPVEGSAALQAERSRYQRSLPSQTLTPRMAEIWKALSNKRSSYFLA